MLESGASVASTSQVYISAMLLLLNVGKQNVRHWAYLQWHNVHNVWKSVTWLKNEMRGTQGTCLIERTNSFLSGKGSWRNVSSWLAMFFVCVLVCLSVCHIWKFEIVAGIRRFSKNCKKGLLAWLCLSVCPSARNHSVPTKRIFIKFGFWAFSRSLWKN